jgi:hypothetical protein
VWQVDGRRVIISAIVSKAILTGPVSTRPTALTLSRLGTPARVGSAARRAVNRGERPGSQRADNETDQHGSARGRRIVCDCRAFAVPTTTAATQPNHFDVVLKFLTPLGVGGSAPARLRDALLLPTGLSGRARAARRGPRASGRAPGPPGPGGRAHAAPASTECLVFCPAGSMIRPETSQEVARFLRPGRQRGHRCTGPL